MWRSRCTCLKLRLCSLAFLFNNNNMNYLQWNREHLHYRFYQQLRHKCLSQDQLLHLSCGGAAVCAKPAHNILYLSFYWTGRDETEFIFVLWLSRKQRSRGSREMWDCSFQWHTECSGRGRRGCGVRTHSVLLDGCFIGYMIHPGIEGVFCVISIDLNTLRGFQDSVEGGEGGCQLQQ